MQSPRTTYPPMDWLVSPLFGWSEGSIKLRHPRAGQGFYYRLKSVSVRAYLGAPWVKVKVKTTS
jgi:hypothetical protein